MRRTALAAILLPGLFCLVIGQPPADTTKTPEHAITEKFESVLRQSNRYKEGGKAYEIIRAELFEDLQSTVTGTIGQMQRSAETTTRTLEDQQLRIASLEAELAAAQEQIGRLDQEKDTMRFLGLVGMNKGLYRTVMWLIVAGLATALLVLAGSYARSHAVTRQTRAQLEKTRGEYEAYRKKSLEDEMVLRRQLQDEINKRL